MAGDCRQGPGSVAPILKRPTNLLVTVAHKIVLTRVAGEPPAPGMDAAHAPVICHNRACVNPKHLRWATRAENFADKVPDGTAPRGEACGAAKLTARDVQEIRSSAERGMDLAARFGVSQATISTIRARKTWAHLP